MGRNGLRRIHVVLSATGSMPTVDELEAWISDNHPKARQDFDVEKSQSDGGLRCCIRPGPFDPVEHAKRVERARNGGKKSRRGATFTADQLAAVAHMSIREQAKALGCSEATISRRRREQKAAEFSQLLAAMEGPKAAVTPEIKPAPVVDIKTRQPLEDPILAALELERAETMANPYEHLAEVPHGGDAMTVENAQSLRADILSDRTLKGPTMFNFSRFMKRIVDPGAWSGAHICHRVRRPGHPQRHRLHFPARSTGPTPDSRRPSGAADCIVRTTGEYLAEYGDMSAATWVEIFDHCTDEAGYAL